MKTKSSGEKADDLRPQYDLRELLKEGIQGKCPSRWREGTNLVLLAPDVAEAFPTEKAVNDALRLVIRLREIAGRQKKTTVKA